VNNKRLPQKVILHRLAEGLPDDILQKLFPGYAPDEIRQSLCAERTKTTAGSAKTVMHSPDPHSTAGPGGQLPNRSCRLFTDGASRGNPGHAGAGAVLLTGQNEELAACSAYLGVCTNNIAEYRALLLGLDEAQRHGCTELAIFLDSELIVRQLEGRYKVKSETLLPLFNAVQKRLSTFHHWSIAHVPRKENTRADELANQGIDKLQQK